MSEHTTLPTDWFSRRLRELRENPGAVRTQSTINRHDFLGNSETWVVDTFRLDGKSEVFLQRMGTGEPIRTVLPPEITAAITRQQDRATTVLRRRAGRTAIAKRIARGDDLTAGLRKHRKGGGR